MRSNSVLFALLSLTLLISYACNRQLSYPSTPVNYRMGFYNVENLFDTLDHPTNFDDDFTPSGRQEWRTDRYQKKLRNIEAVVAGMGFPSLLGLCEVENASVLADFAKQEQMAPFDYGYVHYESPDRRGIDVALMYKKAEFEVGKSDFIRVPFPDSIEADYTSRDILHVQGKLAKMLPVHVFINHWPSRRGGVRESEPKRVHVANHLREAVDQIFAADPNANIIIMGDFNDETNNKSVATTLSAKSASTDFVSTELYNCMAKLDEQNKGSYNYRGNWNMLDQIIVSGALANPDAPAKVGLPTIFRQEWMMYKDPKHGERPSRTYGGPNYYGGYSDHLPVFVDVILFSAPKNN